MHAISADSSKRWTIPNKAGRHSIHETMELDDNEVWLRSRPLVVEEAGRKPLGRR